MSTSFINIHCKALFTLVEPRCALFIQDAIKFKIISEDVKNYITQSLKDKKCSKAMDFFVDYIDIHVLLMHQFAYLYYGICSFLFHFDELNQDRSSNPNAFVMDNVFEASLSSFAIKNAYEGGSKYLTPASIEGIKILNHGKIVESLKKVELDVYSAYTEIGEKVKEIAELFISHNLTNNHSSNWNRQKQIGQNMISDIFHYKFNVIKSNKEVHRSVQFERTSYQCITDEMNEFHVTIQKKLLDTCESNEISTINVIEAINAEASEPTFTPSTLIIADGTTDVVDASTNSTSNVLVSIETTHSVIASPNIISTIIVASDAVMQNYSKFALVYRNLSVDLEENVLRIKMHFSEKFLLELKSSSTKNWVKIFDNFRHKIYTETKNIMRLSFLYSKALKSSNLLVCFEKFCVNLTLLNHVKHNLDAEENKVYDQIPDSQSKRVNRFIQYCVVTVCVNFIDTYLTKQKNLLSNFDIDIEKFLTSNDHFMEVLRTSKRSDIQQLARTYEIYNVIYNVRSSERNTCKDINYEGTSSSSKRSNRRKVEVVTSNKLTPSKVLQRRECESADTDRQSIPSKKSKVRSEILCNVFVDLPDDIPKLSPHLEIISVAEDQLNILEEQKRHFELKLAQKDKEIAERDAEIKNLKEKLSAFINFTD
jgi:hypothetical protein